MKKSKIWKTPCIEQFYSTKILSLSLSKILSPNTFVLQLIHTTDCISMLQSGQKSWHAALSVTPVTITDSSATIADYLLPTVNSSSDFPLPLPAQWPIRSHSPFATHVYTHTHIHPSIPNANSLLQREVKK